MAVCIWLGTTDSSWSTATNWSGGAVPGSGDTAVIPANATVDIDGSDETSSPIDKLVIEKGCSISIGSVDTPLKLSFSGETNAEAHLAGTGVKYLDLTEAKAIYITEAGGASTIGAYALNLTATSATNSTKLYIDADDSDDIGIAANGGDVGEFDNIYISGGNITIGESVSKIDGTSAPPIVISGGTVETKCKLDTASVANATWTHSNGTVSSASVINGTLYLNTNDTITTLHLGKNAKLDATGSAVSKTITTLEMTASSAVNDPQKTISIGTLKLLNCGFRDITLDVGRNWSVSLTSL
ncbi:MAG: hypothetical protein DRN20_00475 [Thermoplasmata archaeon]|nr:MAG: hypothetical protein DRN20_00475 [Thermoplasmata archaeon]